MLLIDTSTHNAIKQFQLYIDIVIANSDNVYTCYDLFILFKTDTILTKIYPDFISAIKTAIIDKDNLKYCRHINAGSHFCNSCFIIVVEKKIIKFGFANYINVFPCQKYSNIFNNLTAIEKLIIAHTPPIMSIIKLRASGSSPFASYY